MRLLRAIHYPFRGEKWFKKLLTGAIISVIPLVNIIVEGYANDVTRQIAEGREASPPRWGKFGGYFIEGVSQWVSRIFHYGLVLGLLILLWAPFLNLPERRVGTPGSFEERLELLKWGLISLGLMGCIGLFILVVAVWMGFYLMASDIRYSTGEARFGQLFEVKQNVNYFRAHRFKIIGAWIVATVFWGLLTLISSTFVLIPFPYVGEVLGAIFWLSNGFIIKMFTAHIHGQVAFETL